MNGFDFDESKLDAEFDELPEQPRARRCVYPIVCIICVAKSLVWCEEEKMDTGKKRKKK
jgi:hypothetical protein